MTNQRQVFVIGVRLYFLELVDRKQDVGFATLIYSQPAVIERPLFGHQGSVGGQIMLNTGDEISARREHVGQERVLGILDGIAVTDNRDRQLPIAGVGF